jgi:alkylation response protein AidB-like acyl-CoA dehydrogenase
MRLLELERAVLERHAPGLDQTLADIGIGTLEQAPSPGLSIFRDHRAGRLLVPKEFGGLGASALEALRFQIALASRAPSMALATTMHQYKIAALGQLIKGGRDLSATMKAICQNDWLVASGGSEGEPGRTLYTPSMTARDADDGNGILVTGTKKPCSLTWSMDLLSVMLRSSPDSRYGGELLHVLVDPNHPSVQRERFWTNPILAAAENDAVTLNDTPVAPEHIFPIGSTDDAKPFALAAFGWFELLACGAYMGVVGAMLERMLQEDKGSKLRRAEISIQHDTLLAALEFMAVKLDGGELDSELLSRIFRIRYFAEKAIPQMAALCLEAIGGLTFGRSAEVGYLALASRVLYFHPPSMASMADNLSDQLLGENLILS